MSKAEEATNDFCTRCFKYDRCAKVQSECTTADSYQEGYEDGYHQAEKELELSWEDIRDIFNIYEEVIDMDFCEDIYGEVLKRFKETKK